MEKYFALNLICFLVAVGDFKHISDSFDPVLPLRRHFTYAYDHEISGLDKVAVVIGSSRGILKKRDSPEKYFGEKYYQGCNDGCREYGVFQTMTFT